MSRSSGSSLIEVVVATGIFVTIAAGTAQLFALAIRDGVAGRQQLAMSTSAAAKLDEIAAVIARDVAPAGSVGALDRAAPGFSDVTTASGASFERRWLIAPLPANGPTAVVIVVRIAPLARRAVPDMEMATIAEARLP